MQLRIASWSACKLRGSILDLSLWWFYLLMQAGNETMHLFYLLGPDASPKRPVLYLPEQPWATYQCCHRMKCIASSNCGTNPRLLSTTAHVFGSPDGMMLCACAAPKTRHFKASMHKAMECDWLNLGMSHATIWNRRELWLASQNCFGEERVQT